jgi:hypothetical protein
MSKEYAICPNCKKSNLVIEPRRNEQICVFCGQLFIILNKKETKLISEPKNNQRNRTTRNT